MRVSSKIFPALVLLILLHLAGCERPSSVHQATDGEPAAVESRADMPELKWSYHVGTKLPERMELRDGEVLFADSTGAILAANIEDGSIRTILQTPAPITGWAQAGPMVVTSSIDKRVRFSNLDTGEELWSAVCETTPSEPSMPGAQIAYSEGLGPYSVKHHSAINGDLRWDREFDAKPSGFASIDGGLYIFIILSDGSIVSLDSNTGGTFWSYEVGEPIPPKKDNPWWDRFSYLDDAGRERMSVSPMFGGGIGRMLYTQHGLLVPCEDGYLRMLDTVSGELIWDINFEERVLYIWRNPYKSGQFFVETIDGQFARVNVAGDILASGYLEIPTGGIFHPARGMIIVDSDSDGVAIIRDLVSQSIIEPFEKPFPVIPIGGLIEGNTAVVRTNDGRIVGIQMPPETD